MNGKAGSLRHELVRGGDKIIGTVGRLSDEKGHTYLVKAAKRVLEARGDCFFMIVGDGPLRDSLENEAASFGIRDRFIFTGIRRDIPELLSAMDIFILPSLTEGQPMALLEAMASGRPIVASRVGDVPKLLKNGEIGTLVQPCDAEANARAILRYLDNPLVAERNGALVRDEALRNHSSARMAEEYARLYDRLIRECQAAGRP